MGNVTGTYNLRIASGSVVLGGPSAWFFTGITDPTTVLNTRDGNDAGVQSVAFGGADGTYTLRCYCDLSNIILDGGSPIGFGQVPVGFRVLTQQGNAYIGLSQTDQTNVRVTNQWFFANSSFGSTFNVGPTNFLGFVTGPLLSGSSPSFMRLFGIGFGLNIVTTWGGAANGYWKIDFLEINGTYDIVPLTWAVNGHDAISTLPSIPIISANSKETIILTSPASTGGTALDFTHAPVSIQYIDLNGVVQTVAATPLATNPDNYPFTVPPLPNIDPTKPITIIAVGDGTQFSGTVALGILTITIANGAGIYVITSGKTADTFYTNSAVNNTTADTKILDPFIKTGFIP